MKSSEVYEIGAGLYYEANISMCYDTGIYIMNLEKWLQLLTNAKCLQNRLDAGLLPMWGYFGVCGSRKTCCSKCCQKNKWCLNPSKYLLSLKLACSINFKGTQSTLHALL